MLILTTFDEDQYIVAALHSGASGFIGKGVEPQDIVQAVTTVHHGDELSSVAAKKRLNRIVAKVDPRDRAHLVILAYEMASTPHMVDPLGLRTCRS